MDDYEKIRKNIEDKVSALTEHIGLVIRYYVMKGWFFDFEIPINRNFVEIALYDTPIFESYMKKYFKGKIDEIEMMTINRFPSRSKIISKAIQSHRNGDYELAIPVLLTQIDGIFRELTKKEIFSAKDKRRAEKVFNKFDTKNVNKKVLTIALTPLREYEILSASFNKSIKYPNIIARNPILHGYKTDYANETNGLKTISLLNYVVRVVYDILTGVDFLKQIRDSYNFTDPYENK
jgi:hypothetical protein